MDDCTRRVRLITSFHEWKRAFDEPHTPDFWFFFARRDLAKALVSFKTIIR